MSAQAPVVVGGKPEVLLRLRDVCQIVGLSRSTIYKRLADGRFPKPVRLGERAVRWPSNEIATWWRTEANPAD